MVPAPMRAGRLHRWFSVHGCNEVAGLAYAAWEWVNAYRSVEVNDLQASTTHRYREL